jgi:hypothetical protein
MLEADANAVANADADNADLLLPAYHLESLMAMQVAATCILLCLESVALA